MAKKETTKAPAAAAASANADARAKLPDATETKAAAPKTIDTFFFKKAVAEGEKLAPQARVIVNVLSTSGEKGMSRDDLVSALKGKLVTRQPEGRILTYYQKTLVERGYLVIETSPVA